MGPAPRRARLTRSSETAAGVRLLICSLDGDRNHSEAGDRSVVRCLSCSAIDPHPTDNSCPGSPGLLLKLVRIRPNEFLELAWIVRKKPIWSPS